MEIITVILGVLLAVAVFLLFQKNQAPLPAVSEEPKPRKLTASKAAPSDDVRAELSESKQALARVRSDLEKKEAELKRLRDDNKGARQKQADRLKELESEKSSLNGRVQQLEQRLRGLSSAEGAREEMLVLQQRVLELEAELRSGSRRSSAPAAAPVSAAAAGGTLMMTAVGSPSADMDDDGEVVASTGSAGEDLNAQLAEQRESLNRLRARYREQVRELKESFNTQFKQERSGIRDELHGMKTRLRRALNETERERRRAENTDRAYSILKAQLEGALDRLSQFDPAMRRPDTIDPEMHRREMEQLAAARAAEAAPLESNVVESESSMPEAVEADSPADTASDASDASEASGAVEASDDAEAAAQIAAEESLESVQLEEPRVAAPPETRPLPGTLPGVDDDAWLDEDVEAKLTGSFKTV